MTLIIDDKHAFISFTQTMQQICEPLKEFSIDFVTFLRCFDNGKQIYLSTYSQWVLDYYNLELFASSEFSQNSELDQPTFVLWSSLNESRVLSYGREYYNSDNGITVILPHEGYCDYFFFSSTQLGKEQANFYLNQKDYIQAFCWSFIEKIDTELQHLKKDAIILSPKKTKSLATPPQGQNDEQIKNSYQTFKPKHFSFYENGNKITQLSARESECALMVMEGNSAKHIANRLNLSSRTVEKHLEAIRSKLNCYNRQELIEKLLLSWPIFLEHNLRNKPV